MNAAEAGAGLTIGGTTTGVEDGQTLSLTLVDAGGNTVDSYTATVAGNAWSIGVTAAQAQALLDGAYTVTASVADLAGNSAAQVIGTLDVDETLPSIAFTAPLAGDGRVNAAEAGAGFSVVGTTIGVEDGQIATIALLDAGGNTVHSYTATITGNAWSISVSGRRCASARRRHLYRDGRGLRPRRQPGRSGRQAAWRWTRPRPSLPR